MKEQRTEYRFDAGIDDSVWPTAATNKLAVLNGEYTRDGGVAKRHGYSTYASFTSAQPARALLPVRDGLAVVRHDLADLMRSGGDAFQRHHNWHANLRTVAHAVAPSQDPAAILTSPNTIDAAVLTVGGVTYVLTLVAVTDEIVGATDHRWYVHAEDTGHLVGSGTLDTSARVARVGVCGSRFIIAYVHVTSDDLVAVVIDPTGVPPALGSPQTIVTGTLNNALLDAYTDEVNDRMLFVVRDGGNIRLARISQSGGTITVVHSTTHAIAAGLCWAIARTSDGFVHVAYGTATGFVVLRFSDDLATLLTTSTPAGATAADHDQIAVGVNPTTNLGLVVVAATAANGGTMALASLTSTHGTVSSVRNYTDTVLLSKPFIDYATGQSASLPAVLITRGSSAATDISPVMLVRLFDVNLSTDDNDHLELAAVVAEAGALAPGTLSTDARLLLPNVPSVRATDVTGRVVADWYLPHMRRWEQSSGGSDGAVSLPPRAYAARVAKLEHAMNDQLPRVTAHGLALMGGALMRAYDGALWTELAPHVCPPAPTITEPGGVGAVPAGTYTFYAAYAFVDVAGVKWRGAVSPPTTFTKTGAAGATVLMATISPRIPTMRGDDCAVGQWYYELYRTAASGSVARLCASLPCTSGTPTAVGYTVDGESDTELADNLLLYTHGELPSEPPPPASALAVHDNRVFLADAADRRRVWYSKEFVEGFGVEFNASLSFRVDADVVTLVSMDDSLLVFTADRVYAVAGGGLNAAGQGTNYLPEQVARVGCSGPYNAVALPLGTLFHAPSGMHVLGRDMQLTDVSGPISGAGSAFISTPPRALVHVPDIQRVYVLLGTERTGLNNKATMYVLDYARGRSRWLQHDNRAAVDTCTQYDAVWANGKVWFLAWDDTADRWRLMYRDTTTYGDSDGTTTTPLYLTATLVNFRPDGAGLLDEFRIRRVHVVASCVADTDNTATLQLLYSPSPNPSHDASELEVYDWAAESVEDGTYAHVVARPKFQRVTAVTLALTHGTPSAAGERGVTMHAIAVDWVPSGRTARRGSGYDPTVT